jgi:hypothetical protein
MSDEISPDLENFPKFVFSNFPRSGEFLQRQVIPDWLRRDTVQSYGEFAQAGLGYVKLRWPLFGHVGEFT